MNWLNTAPDIKLKILLYLSYKDIKNFCLVYKSKICDRNSILWRKLISKDFNIEMIEPYGDNLKEDYVKFLYFNRSDDADSDYYFQNNENLIEYGKYAIKLRISWCDNITNEGLKYTPNVTCLKLQDFSCISNKGLKHIPNLSKLVLKGNENITDEGLKYLHNLTYLDLSWNRNITNEGLKYVPNLSELKLIGNFNIDRAALSGVKIYDE